MTVAGQPLGGTTAASQPLRVTSAAGQPLGETKATVRLLDFALVVVVVNHLNTKDDWIIGEVDL